MPGRSDLCFATTNRQSALLEIAERCDAVVVIGSANSSNTRALEALAREAGTTAVYRINGPEELPEALGGTIGVTAGASAPEDLVDAVISALGPLHGVEEISYTNEDEYFRRRGSCEICQPPSMPSRIGADRCFFQCDPAQRSRCGCKSGACRTGRDLIFN